MGFRACRVFEDAGGVAPRLVEMDTDELSPGDVVVRVDWSGVNFKDALALGGRGRILRRLPLNAGIDAAGVVESSKRPPLSTGRPGADERHGPRRVARRRLRRAGALPADWLVPLPSGLTLREAMALGTAGFTAALAIQRMELNGQRPALGPVVVTGATGGVGSVAVSILSGRGYAVIAVSGRPEHRGYLHALGAAEVVTPEELKLGTRPLEQARFGGAIDNVGGELLAGLTRHVGFWGQIACIGMAAAPELAGTVFPLILRGVSLLGISSANCPMTLRTEVWNRLGGDLKPGRLDAIVSDVVPLDGVVDAAGRLLERRALGRILVDCGGGRHSRPAAT